MTTASRSDADAAAAVESFTRGMGTDAVILAASTRSNQPVELALEFARPRSTVVVVGAVGMEIPRSPFYEKELHLTISCSYGPGRYDPLYEQAGHRLSRRARSLDGEPEHAGRLDLMARGTARHARARDASVSDREALPRPTT